ncbi:MAG: hypothetical protein KBT31_03705, partial [Firmicutes bacterium]|nr:hypothetical protein [Candidatus Colimorpha enterica]
MTEINVDFSKKLGRIKPMHAVNNGPVMARKDQTRGNNISYKEARIPYARNHDAAFWSGYGGEHTVDVLNIFPNFDADPEDPASYDFVLTDRYITETLECGTETFYRLGAKIEHTPIKYHIFPPKDYKKYAVICEHIIRHMNYGWANGHHFGITYWEIWNEPENNDPVNPLCWAGTDEQFFDFYEVMAKHLKSCFPELRIGGPSSCGDIAWKERFLSEMKKRNVPMDFFSWHIYNTQTEAVTDLADSVHDVMVRTGYGDAESILNEWNYVKGWSGPIFGESIMHIIGIKGAAFEADVMIRSHHHPVDMLMYYDARPTAFNGLWNYYDYKPLKGYYPICMFSDLYALGTEVETAEVTDGVSALAATDGEKGAIMLAYYTDDDEATEEKTVSVIVSGLDLDKADICLVDKDSSNAKKTVDLSDCLTVTMKP